MGLEEMKCAHCKTAFYGVKDRDTHCILCKTIIMFREFFGLQDIEINEIDFNRVREPKFEESVAGMSHKKDWRNFIPEGLKKMWLQLSFETRVMAIMFAEVEARAVDIISDNVAGMIKKKEES